MIQPNADCPPAAKWMANDCLKSVGVISLKIIIDRKYSFHGAAAG